MSTTGTRQAWARGGMIFAATMMLIIGIYQIFIGIAAIAQKQLVIVGDNYTYTTNTTWWGWIHLVIGAIAVVAGFFLFTGATWARAVAIALAGLSALANFFFILYFPIWSLVIIALDVFVIWAIAAARVPEREEMLYRGTGAGAYGDTSTGERWPGENQPAGRHWASDTKPAEAPRAETAEQARERAAARSSQYPPPGSSQHPQDPYQPPSG